jgi:hypothetical protein
MPVVVTDANHPSSIIANATSQPIPPFRWLLVPEKLGRGFVGSRAIRVLPSLQRGEGAGWVLLERSSTWETGSLMPLISDFRSFRVSIKAPTINFITPHPSGLGGGCSTGRWVGLRANWGLQQAARRGFASHLLALVRHFSPVAIEGGKELHRLSKLLVALGFQLPEFGLWHSCLDWKVCNLPSTCFWEATALG